MTNETNVEEWVNEGRTIHELKTWPEYYASVESGEKTFEVRKNDRCFQVGDILHLREYSIETMSYTGKECFREVAYILHGQSCFGLHEDTCVLALRAALTRQGDETAQGEAIDISVVQYGDIWACEFTIGVQTFTVCERDNKEVADAYAKNLRTAFNNAYTYLTFRTAEQKAMSQKEVDRFLNHADEMNEELQSRITDLEAENKRLREAAQTDNKIVNK
jgi:hypothetical protein